MNPTGWIAPKDRTQDQQDGHETITKTMPKFALAPATLNKGERIILTDVWKHPDVVSDVGQEFVGFLQYTGSCIGVSMGNALFTLGGVQRLVSDNPTKAFISFWPFDYGRTRYNEGDRGQGEGAINSYAVRTMKTEGVLPADTPGLPQFAVVDGLVLGSDRDARNLELKWSDGGSSLVTAQLDAAKKFPLGTATPVNDAQSVITGIVNGYPGYYGCSMYVGGGSIRGSGDAAYVRGAYDGSGGHSTCILGAWNHPNDGYLFLYSNQWSSSTYPKDPAGGGRCTCWIPESELSKVWSRYDGQNEFFLLSHLTYFPAQPKVAEVLTWTM